MAFRYENTCYVINSAGLKHLIDKFRINLLTRVLHEFFVGIDAIRVKALTALTQ